MRPIRIPALFTLGWLVGIVVCAASLMLLEAGILDLVSTSLAPGVLAATIAEGASYLMLRNREPR